MIQKKRPQMHQELIDACRKQNSRAQMEIYRLYYKAMYNTALRMLNDTAEAEDVMQESFLSAFRNIGTYRGEVAFGAWLKKIVVNRCLDIIKSRKAVISIESVGDIPEEGESADEMDTKDLEVETVKRAIRELPEGYRIVLSLFLIEGYDHDEISQILNITNSTSRTQYHRAKKKLYDRIKELKNVS